MIQELMVKLGLDGKPFQRGVTAIKAQLNQLATDKWTTFKQALSVGAAVEGMHQLGKAMIELRRNAEDVGSSIGFLYTLQTLSEKFGGTAEDATIAMAKLAETIGSARMEGGEAASKFERFGIALYNSEGAARSTEEVFKSIAEVYKNSSDAATKAAIAFEFFGRTGRNINNVLAEGKQGLEEYRKTLFGLETGFNKGEAEAIADLWQTLKDVFWGATDALKGFVGRTIDGVGSIGRLTGALSSGKSFLEAWNQEMEFWENRDKNKTQDGGTKAADDEILAKKAAAQEAKKQRDELEKIREIEEKIAESKRASLADTDDKKIQNLKLELMLAEEALDLTKGEKEAAEQRLKIEQARVKLLDAEKKRRDDIEEKNKKLKEDDAADHIAKMDRLHELIEAKKKEKQDMAEAKEARFKFSLQELAEADPRRFRGQTRQDILGAREVQRLESQAQWQNLFGTKEQRDKLQAMADQRRQQIGLLKTDEKFPFRDLEKSGSESAEALKTLLKYAESKGIRMQAYTGK